MTRNTTISFDDNWQFEPPVNFNTITVDGLTGGDGVFLLNDINVGVLLLQLSATGVTGTAAYAGLTSLSGNWQDTYTIVQANSASWDEHTGLTLLSGNWQDTFTQVQANSASWDEHTGLTLLSGNWQDTFTAVQANSASWNEHSGLAALSGNWEDTFTAVQANSATWNDHSGLAALSGNWEDTYTTVEANSTNWDDAFTTVQATSATWGGGGGDGTSLSALSGNWEDTFTTVQANSATWEAGDASEVWVNTNFVNTSGDTMAGDLNMGGNTLSSVNNLQFDGTGIYDNDSVLFIDVENWKVTVGGSDEADFSTGALHFGGPQTLNWHTHSLVGGWDITSNFYVSGEIVTSNHGGSENWSDAFTTVQANSADWTASSVVSTMIERIVQSNDNTILANGTFNIILPPVDSSTNRLLDIKNTGTGIITISANQAELIDEANTVTILRHVSLSLKCDGLYWWII